MQRMNEIRELVSARKTSHNETQKGGCVWGAEIAEWLGRRTRDGKVSGSSPAKECG